MGDGLRDSDGFLDAGVVSQGLEIVDAAIAKLKETRAPVGQKRQKGLNSSTAGEPWVRKARMNERGNDSLLVKTSSTRRQKFWELICQAAVASSFRVRPYIIG
jgi:hypothetical protein